MKRVTFIDEISEIVLDALAFTAAYLIVYHPKIDLLVGAFWKTPRLRVASVWLHPSL